MLRYGVDDILLNTMSLVLLSICVIAPLAFAFTRLYMLHHTYNALISERDNDSWLLQQCQHHEFYHNMKHHSSLCDDLSTRRRDSILMTSIQRVIEDSYMCGFEPCTASLDALAQWMMGRGFVVMVGGTIAMLTIPSAVLPCLRRRMNVIADNRLRQLHHAPYGHNNYNETAFDRRMSPWNTTVEGGAW